MCLRFSIFKFIREKFFFRIILCVRCFLFFFFFVRLSPCWQFDILHSVDGYVRVGQWQEKKKHYKLIHGRCCFECILNVCLLVLCTRALKHFFVACCFNFFFRCCCVNVLKKRTNANYHVVSLFSLSLFYFFFCSSSSSCNFKTHLICLCM